MKCRPCSPVPTTSNGSTRIRQLALPVGQRRRAHCRHPGEPRRLFRSRATAGDIAERVYTGLEWGVSSVRSTCSANASSVRRSCINGVRLMANPTAQRGAANGVGAAFYGVSRGLSRRGSQIRPTVIGEDSWNGTFGPALCPYFLRDGWYGGAPRSLEHPAAPSAPHLWIVVNSVPARCYNALSHKLLRENIFFCKAPQTRPRTLKLPLVEQCSTPDRVVP